MDITQVGLKHCAMCYPLPDLTILFGEIFTRESRFTITVSKIAGQMLLNSILFGIVDCSIHYFSLFLYEEIQ